MAKDFRVSVIEAPPAAASSNNGKGTTHPQEPVVGKNTDVGDSNSQKISIKSTDVTLFLRLVLREFAMRLVAHVQRFIPSTQGGFLCFVRIEPRKPCPQDRKKCSFQCLKKNYKTLQALQQLQNEFLGGDVSTENVHNRNHKGSEKDHQQTEIKNDVENKIPLQNIRIRTTGITLASAVLTI
ncbi:hypothetical protein NC652_033275 [Populus alba x Populus x berolinensis]|nr:hypothetical protein NC652_033275 [Populus alba x Populus x berolinensis]